MLLERCTWPEVEAHLGRSTGIILPVGSVEQHGPNGLIGTDALCAEAVATLAAERAEALVAPCLRVGIAQHHLAFAGTLALRPTTLIAVIEDVASSLARHGFTHVLIVNGHGGNLATLGAACQSVYDAASRAGRPSPLRFKVTSWWDPPSVKALVQNLFGAAEGSHATASEIAVTRALHPDRVDPRPLEPRVAPSRSPFADALDYRRRYPDGRIGSDPSLATEEAGRAILETAADAVADTYRAFLAEA